MKKSEILKIYNISDATLRNWKKLKYINDINNIDPNEIDKILKTKVGVRRNKRSSNDNIIPQSYVSDKRMVSKISKILELRNKYNIETNQVLYEAILKLLNSHNKEIPNDINKYLGKKSNNEDFINDFNNITISYEENNDFIGCLYMSLLSVGNKDTNGIYYTPYKVVNEIVKSIKFETGQNIVDPGCGSGNFLIQIFKKMRKDSIKTEDIIKNLYGFDIDPIACFLAKINIYILDKDIQFDSINIKTLDFLNDYCNIKFDHIIGNPPWGKKYTASEKKTLSKKYGKQFSKLDSFAQFIVRSFELLNENGYLSFVLPSSILNIGTHEYIRKFLLNNKIIYIKRMGREFEEIVTDVILLQAKKENGDNNICEFDNIKIKQDTFKNNAYCNFLVSDEIASNIIRKIENINHFHLDDNIEYALGIVTGNNKKYISHDKNNLNEPIISGKDISKYKMDYSTINSYIIYERDKLQQVAKDELYRSKKKIIYKFIGKKLCFAVENKGILTLNSANIICVNNNQSINYISAVLNSRITQLYFDEKYNTHKVLKNHIKSFCIPIIEEKIMDKISKIIDETNNTDTYIEQVESILYNSLGLIQEEIKYLKDRYK